MKIQVSKRICSLILSIFTFSFLLACGSEPSAPEKKAATLVRPAKLIEIGQSKNDEFLKYPAVIQSQRLSTLSFEVSGVVRELFVVEAQQVKKGEVLAKLDQRDLRVQLKSARAQYKNADEEYQRAVRLIKEDAISRSELEQRKSDREVLKAQLESEEKALQDSILFAPYAGNIARVSIQEQQAVQAGEPAIVILGVGGLEASINLPSSIVAKARKQKRSEIGAYLTLSAAPDRRIPVTFKEVTLDADVASQTYEVTFTFLAPDDLNVLPGMNASIWFKDPDTVDSKTPQATVPLTAIVTDGEQKYVWVVNRESMVVTRRNITVEDGIGSNLKVSSGLELGETIVAAGVSSLSEGMKVRPWSK
jgi:RND family efflux transporter MFP subunit